MKSAADSAELQEQLSVESSSQQRLVVVTHDLQG